MKIYFKKGEREGETLYVNPPGIFIGRELDNDLILRSEGVSKYHAKIIFDNDGWKIHDLDSANTTKVNGVKLSTPIPICSGDMVHIAGNAFQISFETIESKIIGDAERGDDAIKINPPHEPPKARYKQKNEFTPPSAPSKRINKKKKARRRIVEKREGRRLVQEILREKKKKLKIISLILAVIANSLIFWWWYYHMR